MCIVVKRAILAACVILSTSLPAMALDKPTGEVILTIVGKDLKHPNAPGAAEFDLAMLESLNGRSGTMETPWTEGKTTFSGPLLRAVLEAAGAEGEKLKVRALNDYVAEVPISDADTLDTMLATRMNGEIMSVRNKGPIFLIYPFDLDKSLYNEKYFSRSVWQIKAIEVEP
ncbi:hypothetical protein SAMN05880582_103200 [Rhizobium sp. RU20A]|uniref:molybdopterin-dependent oxidoreductase n=1 Tax=Rhizobium sp. RU20A TaxID=1907412 RepID=UPI000955BB31|nr:molybdopterin-dependent oxidoreductase [Rhizobium sp. RU20A]SIQ74493.1 hypothetical protein SAMN05880582_103200 [Rhizobium sp. RU20A]